VSRTAALLAAMAVVTAVATLSGCSPAFNWRDVQLEPSGLTALLPCKPDRATRDVVLGGDLVALQMAGCEAGGATFTVAYAVARDATQATAWREAWKTAMATKLQAQQPVEAPVLVRGADAVPAPLRLTAEGSDAAGRKVSAQVWWFAQSASAGAPAGVTLYQATMLGQPAELVAATTFFEGLQLH